MKYTRLGQSGLEVSRVALGMMAYGDPAWRPWILDEAAARPLFRQAVELGINYFDTADMYSAGASETVTGRLVREFCRRDETVVASKLFYPVDPSFKGASAAGPRPPRRPNLDGLSRKRIMRAVDQSLQRLDLDHIDLYQIHRFDEHTPIEETMEALHDVVKAGKVLYLGASSMAAWQFANAQHIARQHGWPPFTSMQNHYNLAYREEEREMIPLCFDQGVAVLPWSPLARGFLAGNRAPGDSQDSGLTVRARTDAGARRYYYRDADFRVVENLTQLARHKGVSNATLALAWLMHKGVTAPVIGATQLTHVEQAVAACDVELNAAEIEQLEAAYEPHAVMGLT